EKLVKQVKEKGMSPKSVEWFTQFFKWGAVPHGGFAIGIERLTQNLLNLSNPGIKLRIRNKSPIKFFYFPRQTMFIHISHKWVWV
ncbi:hypothetical protein HY448_02420, partial [Candidatus Pacearchaeota archaeon]|nr:hypothetical protein [Candidatus Pacearchaeota archaeon]